MQKLGLGWTREYVNIIIFSTATGSLQKYNLHIASPKIYLMQIKMYCSRHPFHIKFSTKIAQMNSDIVDTE